ncbi:hypothetical protein Pan181_32760 [Aeoliella mucimassa]|uniref:Uncharacterized protein n=1 Tax=Aeoliella mucimassa TaxID=2527972 RepID=A0A518AQQ3_9BACT|nr:hypothetical protein Pan181_32760 [Aeoliella mucimassa]
MPAQRVQATSEMLTRRIMTDPQDFFNNDEGGKFSKYLSDFEQAVRESGY